MADINGNGNGPYPVQVLNAVRAFIRDVGTPITILLFVGLIYTGYLRSPLTDAATDVHDLKAPIAEMAASTRNEVSEHAEILHQEALNNEHFWSLYAVMKRTCRNTGKNESEKALCDSPMQAGNEPVAP